MHKNGVDTTSRYYKLISVESPGLINFSIKGVKGVHIPGKDRNRIPKNNALKGWCLRLR